VTALHQLGMCIPGEGIDQEMAIFENLLATCLNWAGSIVIVQPATSAGALLDTKMLRLIRNGLLGLAGVTLMAAAGAQAETYTLLLFEGPGDLAARNDKGAVGQTYWNAYNAYAVKLQSAGVLRGGTALVIDGGVATVDVSGSRRAPLSSSDRKLGGYFIIEVTDMAAAEALAKLAPAVLHGAVEIHQNAPNPTMSAH